MEKNKKKIIILIITIVIISILVYGLIKISNNAINDQEKSKDKNVNVENKVVPEDENKEEELDVSDINYLDMGEEMFAEPKKGETVATISVKNYGDIKVKFFNDVAPKAVENFVTHAKNGYYNGSTFHRVIEEFMIQGGDPNGDGTGGESIWGEPFEKEVSAKYFPFRGTLCMASTSAPKSLGSQFFITQANYVSDPQIDLSLSKNLLDAYKKYGGAPHLHMGYTVFGAVYEGMDVVDEIAKTKTFRQEGSTDPSTVDKPVNPVVIEKIEVTEY